MNLKNFLSVFLSFTFISCTIFEKKNNLSSQSLVSIWLLTELDGTPIPSDYNVHIELQSEDNRTMGNAGCNQFSGNYFQTKNKVTFSNLMSTRKACIDSKRMNTETDFLNSISDKTLTFEKKERQLILKDKSHKLIFRKIDE